MTARWIAAQRTGHDYVSECQRLLYITNLPLVPPWCFSCKVKIHSTTPNRPQRQPVLMYSNITNTDVPHTQMTSSANDAILRPFGDEDIAEGGRLFDRDALQLLEHKEGVELGGDLLAVVVWHDGLEARLVLAVGVHTLQNMHHLLRSLRPAQLFCLLTLSLRTIRLLQTTSTYMLSLIHSFIMRPVHTAFGQVKKIVGRNMGGRVKTWSKKRSSKNHRYC